MNVQLLLDNLAFPEGPRWHDGALFFSDLVSKRVMCLRDKQLSEVVHVEGCPSGLGFMPDGSLLIVSMHDRTIMRWSPDGLKVHADLTGYPGDFLNDMVVDETGRAYVGSRSSAHSPNIHYCEKSGPDAIIAVEPNGSTWVAAEGMLSPNGMVISPDGCALIVAETYARRVIKYDRDARGRLSGRRIFAEFEDVWADGMCLDQEGALWIGSPYSHKFVRVHEGGAITCALEVTGGVACALGGEDGKTLFMLSVDVDKLPIDTTVPDRKAKGGAVYCATVEHGHAGWP